MYANFSAVVIAHEGTQTGVDYGPRPYCFY